MLAVPSRRQAFFATFSRKALEVIKDVPNPPRIMLTGGFVSIDDGPCGFPRLLLNIVIGASQTSTLLMAETLRANHADIIGIGRASIADRLLPRRLFRPLPAAPDYPASSTAHRNMELENRHPSQCN